MFTTFHTHSYFCDGSMTPEDYILCAIRKNFPVIGISSHAPVHFETCWTMKPQLLEQYIETVLSLKEKYRGRIQVYVGLETDFYDGAVDYRNYPGLDYTIGSVHFIHHAASQRYMALDGTAEEFQETRDVIFHGRARELVEKYYQLLTDMLYQQPPSILGHLDVLKKNNSGNRLFSESEHWYRKAVEGVLDAVMDQQVIVEVNTGGIARGYTTEMYPSDWILASMRERNIPLMLNSDAHHPDKIDAYYPQAVEKLKSLGYTQQRVLLDNIWQDIPL
ncbi:MAG: histidinol-phosphatase [Thermoclostridium sp.]|nr:histidinol-phosphatase [Thermoclostridium sp.]